jgi:cytochrome oxidase assembly protein ShyY1
MIALQMRNKAGQARHDRLKRFPWILTLFTAPCLALLIGLGVWQVQRLHWKEGLIDQADAAAKSEPARSRTS